MLATAVMSMDARHYHTPGMVRHGWRVLSYVCAVACLPCRARAIVQCRKNDDADTDANPHAHTHTHTHARARAQQRLAEHGSVSSLDSRSDEPVRHVPFLYALRFPIQHSLATGKRGWLWLALAFWGAWLETGLTPTPTITKCSGVGCSPSHATFCLCSIPTK